MSKSKKILFAGFEIGGQMQLMVETIRKRWIPATAVAFNDDFRGYQNDIKVISSIYDSIYLHMRCDAELIKWVNDTIIPILTVDFIKDIIVHNEAKGGIGYNWYDLVTIHNNASIEEIQIALDKAKEIEE